MCGIAGIYFFDNRNIRQDCLQQMVNSLAHRGPDAEGVFIEDGIGVGHRRLSIIDLSKSADQPFFDNTGRFVTVYNGEIYNYAEIKNKLSSYSFITSGDTEALIASYAMWQEDCFKELDGMFAFAIWDREKKELTLARDRVGVKPLYYLVDDEKIVFASEVRAILASGLVKRKLDVGGLNEYLSYQSVGYPFTLVSGIQQLEPGTYLKVSNGEIIKSKYWNITNIDRYDMSSKSDDLIRSDLRRLLVASVQKRLVSDVSVGAFLSGGIDSSVVVGLMAQDCGVIPNTFNVSFSEKAFDESYYAQLIVDKFRTNHTRIRLSPHVMSDDLENALNAMDIPSLDGINTYVVSKAVKNAGIKVALSGLGGDELFAGYSNFHQYRKLWRWRRIWQKLKVIRAIVEKLTTADIYSSKRFRLKKLLQTDNINAGFVYPLQRTVLPAGIINSLFKMGIPSETALEAELSKYQAALETFPALSQISVCEILGYAQNTLLKDTDQMSMAVGLEIREPFFDRSLIEYSLSIPDVLKGGKYPKSLLVESVSPLLPDEVVFRSKQGFLFPWKVWMKNELESFCDSHIGKLGEREYVNSNYLKEYWKQFKKGNPSVRWSDIWLLVVLEYWLEKNGIN